MPTLSPRDGNSAHSAFTPTPSHPARPRPARLSNPAPTLKVEQQLWVQGFEHVAGCDEVGRGAWAGPVSVGIVVIPRSPRLYKVRDSKLLAPELREHLYGRILNWCVAWAVGHSSPQECDDLGMTRALHLATTRALDDLPFEPDVVLLDGNSDFIRRGEVRTIVGGDRISLAIAAASVVAKVTRDRLMVELASKYPGFNFESNKGYHSPAHKIALKQLGATEIHRRSWSFMSGDVAKTAIP